MCIYINDKIKFVIFFLNNYGHIGLKNQWSPYFYFEDKQMFYLLASSLKLCSKHNTSSSQMKTKKKSTDASALEPYCQSRQGHTLLPVILA